MQKTIELVFHNKSRTKIEIPEKISDKLVMTKNALVKNSQSFIIETSWKKFARVGFSKEEDTNFTECKKGKPTAAPGLSLVEGILYVSDPEQIHQKASNLICLSSGSPLHLEIRNVSTCLGRRWCSEYETEIECEEACHAVTGEIVDHRGYLENF